MRVNTDFKANITLGVLAFGLICTILAISTDHWHEYKVNSRDVQSDIPGMSIYNLVISIN